MRSRVSSDVLLLGLLLVLTLGIAVYAVHSGRTQQDPDFPARRTTYSAAQGGYKALYEVLEALDYPVRRWRYSLDTLTETGTLIVASPERFINLTEWRAVADWVQRGNLLVYLSDHGETFKETVGWSELLAAPVLSSAPAQPTPLALAAPALRTRVGFHLDQAEWTPFRMSGFPRPAADAGQGRPGSASETARMALLVPLYRDTQGATVAFARWGRGAVIVSSSPWSFSTTGLRERGNFAFLLAAITAYGPRAGGRGQRAGGRDGSSSTPDSLPLSPILFDEYHHGYGEARGPLAVPALSLLAPIARLGLAQLVVAWLLLTYAVSRRFGGRVPDEGRVRRSRSEYLGSMASLLRHARAVDLAVVQVRRQFLNDVTRALGLPRDAPEGALLAAAATRGVDPERLRSLLERADRLTRERDRTHQDEAVAVARELAQIRGRI